MRASLAETQALVNELMARTRKLSLDLRPATLDHLGLLPALLMHLRQYSSQTRVRVDFGHSGVEGHRFLPELETAAFRIVQESLTNVARHSGAGEAVVRVWAGGPTLGVQVEDRGVGFDSDAIFAAGSSSGLPGMRDRALLLGGQFSVESRPGGGTRVTAEWALSDALRDVGAE
jgi:signal transduction histidine kinase